MDNQIHEYVKLPKVTKIRRDSNMQRNFEDENTKRYFIDDQGRRSTSDVGGSKVAKGLENKSLYDIQVQGELGEFIKLLKILENYSEVQSINVIQGSLKEFSDTKRFVYLSDGVTERKYVIAEIKLFPNKVVSVIEVEREYKAISTLLVRLEKQEIKIDIYQRNFSMLLNNNGTWDKPFLDFNQFKFITMKHGRKKIDYRARRLYLKLLEV